ncbi:NADPH-hemoprotein reductase [Aureococcus anophagefferens]|uniref:ferredoxin--NADP(+) reductase n=1 Tax=Aureococcus anophagefferens TaxID=44056 RepID=A0ABR1FLV6_AURAN
MYVAALATGAAALVAPRAQHLRPRTLLGMSKVGVYYGTQGQATEAAADLLVAIVNEKLGGAAGETSFLVDECDSRSGTDWDEWYYEDDGLPGIDLAGKNVAVFGCGDSVGYGGNFCDAIDELTRSWALAGAGVGFGHTPAAGYQHEGSKALRGDTFIGLPLDQVNEGDMTEQRLRTGSSSRASRLEPAPRRWRRRAARAAAPRAKGHAVVVSAETVVPDTPGGSAAIAHVVLDVAGMDYVEGQSVSVLPPGDDEKTGKPHKKRRLYTIASKRPEPGAATSELALCVRAVGVTSHYMKDLAPGAELALEGPLGKTMALPDDTSGGLVLIGTSTGAATFRGFLERLGDLSATGPVVLLLGGANREAIPYVAEFEALAADLGPGKLRVELALGGDRVDDGSETTLPQRIADFSLVVKEIIDAGGHMYASGLRGMLKPCEAALGDFVDVKALKKAKQYHAEVYYSSRLVGASGPRPPHGTSAPSPR